MPQFAYSAIDKNGAAVEGIVEAAEEGTAADILLDHGLTVTSLAEASKPFWKRSFVFWEHF